MGPLGTTEVILLGVFFIGIPAFFYWLGKRSGYKQGQLEMYKKQEEERKSSK